MKKVQKLIVIGLLLSILVFAVKKHTDTAGDFFSSIFQVIKEPLLTTDKIQKSETLLGFPDGALEIIASFKEKFPEEKEFFIGDDLPKDPLLIQRLIELNFPKLLNKQARCGFIKGTEGPYQIVCRS